MVLHGSLRLLTALAFGVLLFSWPLSAHGCTIGAATVNFGNYNFLDSSPDTTTGSVLVTCLLATSFSISLSAGSSGTFAPRTMKSGTSALNYNLYTDASHAIVWGDGTSGTQVVSGSINLLLLPFTATVYGAAPAQQNVGVGVYTDSIVETITF